MPRGPHTRALTDYQRNQLEKFRRASHEGAPHGYSVALLRTVMGARFSPETLQKALQGRPVLDLFHSYIVEWIERYLPAEPPPVRDGKSAAAGEREEENGENGEAARTIRGSR
jgi:hypothetical protein